MSLLRLSAPSLRLLRLLARYRGSLLLGGVLLVFTNVLGLTVPWLLRVAVDGIRDRKTHV